MPFLLLRGEIQWWSYAVVVTAMQTDSTIFWVCPIAQRVVEEVNAELVFFNSNNVVNVNGTTADKTPLW